jgi:hypothetical protein
MASSSQASLLLQKQLRGTYSALIYDAAADPDADNNTSTSSIHLLQFKPSFSSFSFDQI